MGICELPVQFFYSKLIKRIKIYILMTVAFSGFIIKDVLLIFVQTVFGVFILQLINIIAVGCYLPSLVYFTNEIIERRPEQNVQAHAMISGTATNLGRVLGSFAGGTLIGLGGVKPMLTTSALVSAAGLIMMLLSQKCRKREEIGI
jgi:predicted MFS family arabinose efflux permease